MMGAATCLHAEQSQLGSFATRSISVSLRTRRRRTTARTGSRANNTAHILAEVDAKHCNLHHPLRRFELRQTDLAGREGRDIEKHFSLYERFLSDECLMVLDDFIIAVGPSKDVGVREWIAKAADAGIVRDLGVHKWATWFGQYQRKLYG